MGEKLFGREILGGEPVWGLELFQDFGFFGAFQKDEDFFAGEDWGIGEGEAVFDGELLRGGMGCFCFAIEGFGVRKKRGDVAVGAYAENGEIES